MRVRRSRAAVAAIVLGLAGLTACDPPPPLVVLTITTNGDGADTEPGDGICRSEHAPGLFGCTLRAAVEEASASHVDRIVSPAWTIALTSPLVIDPVASTLSIVPSDPGRITIDGSALTAPAIDVRGGAVAVRSVAVRDAGDDALAVATGATLVIADGQISGAVAAGIDVQGTLVAVDTTVRDGGSDGIAVAPGAHAVVMQSSLVGNGAAGISLGPFGFVNMESTTTSGNAVGIAAFATADVRLSTMADGVSGSPGTVRTQGSIVVGACGALTVDSAGSNALGAGCGTVGATDVAIGADALDPLVDGDSPHHPISPAASSLRNHIPSGSAPCTEGVVDQLGRVRTSDGSCSVGAHEAIGALGTVTVDTAADGPDAAPGDGVCATATEECTLRAALEEAATRPTDPTPLVTIAPGVDPVLDPDLGGMAVGQVTIDGGGATVDVGGGGRALDYCDGVLTVEDITFTGAAGGSVIDAPCDGASGDIISLDGVTVTGNATSAAISGAGPEPRVFLKVTDSTISDNEVGISGPFGRVVITRSTLSGHSEVAVWGTDFVSIDVIDSTIADNAAGVISEEEDILVRRSTFTGNRVALSTEDGTMRVEQSVISDNGRVFSTYDGGAILTDSTVSGNETVYSSGLSGFFSATRSTFAANERTFQGLDTPYGLAGSVIVPGTGPACEPGVTVESGGWNVAADTTCGFAGTGDVQGVDPLLGPLTDNGGPTASHLPGAGSPAIDAIPAGTAVLCTGTLVDQRGTIRPQGPACDRGAVEQ